MSDRQMGHGSEVKRKLTALLDLHEVALQFVGHLPTLRRRVLFVLFLK